MVPIAQFEVRRRLQRFAGATPPGRLGDTSLTLMSDPRTLPAIAQVAEIVYFDLRTPLRPWPQEIEQMHELFAGLDHEFNVFCQVLPMWVPGDEDEPDVEEEQITIDGLDGNQLVLYVTRPQNQEVDLPAIVYFHGGCLIMIDINRFHRRWAKSLVLRGHVLVIPEFRNAWSKTRYNHFPAGLNDCVAAVDYVDTHRCDLGISTITLHGDDGGANLAIATALRAKREGWVKIIAGVSACSPYIGGEAHSWPIERKLAELPSLVENEGYLLDSPWLGPGARYYSPDNTTNPLAWPLFATEDDLTGLPPHSIVLDELTPVRDEGVVYYRKLVAAGVTATAFVQLGVPHVGVLLFRRAIPDIYENLCNHVSAFAKRLA
ncbi:Brefeldin A esterase [Lecanosticta acicola]|uniref:Brefeldin A esterase n=1 Tax=Lecanosticta acicola TaxID=111012 RepID=A0AAI8YWD3_9PEZI|nr:Brefeldin A esterase [Lecanosticta acicola]